MTRQLVSSLRVFFPLAIAAALIGIPWISSDFSMIMIIRIMYFSMLALSLTYLSSELNQVSLMQAAFYGIAGYFVAILQTRYGLPFPLPPLIGLVMALVAALLFGLLTIRAKGIYFLMLTLVLGQLVWALANQWASMTNGDTGITNVYAPDLFGFSSEESNTVFYFFQLVFFGLAVCLLYALKRSPFGLMLKGVRDCEARMIMLGYSTLKLRYLAFLFAAFVSALGGIFFTYFTGLINPHSVSLANNVETLLATILGGINYLLGAFLGTTILKTLDIVLSGITKRYMLYMGIMFLFVIMFAPRGIVGLITLYWKSFIRLFKSS